MQKEILAVNANDTVTYMLHVTNPTEHDVGKTYSYATWCRKG